MRRLLLILIALLLTTCGSQPLADVNLEPLLIQPGDLPAGLSGAQVKDAVPAMFAALPPAKKSIDQRFQRGGANAGGVTVLLYDSSDDVEKGYAALVQGMGAGTQAIGGVGDKATSLALSGIVQAVDLAFVRCHALVYIRLIGTNQAGDATAYAKRLDGRLQGIVC